MTIATTYTQARSQLAYFFDEVVENNEIVIVNRRGKEDVAMISASELNGLVETAHLMRSPNNARRLLTALQRARANKGTRTSLAHLKREVGLGEA
jgi:antitoxin YefM